MQALAPKSTFCGVRLAAPQNGSRVKMSSSHVFNVEVSGKNYINYSQRRLPLSQ